MADTLTRRTRSDLLAAWDDDQRPALTRIKQRALELADAADTMLRTRPFGYLKARNDKLRDYVADHLKATSDLLGDLHGQIIRDADEAGLAPELLAFDTSDLDEELERWT